MAQPHHHSCRHLASPPAHSTSRPTHHQAPTHHPPLDTGHTIAGYACVPCFSPNGKFLCSGDGEGKLYFWDWKSGKMYNKYKAHDNGPTIGTAWHPIEPSLVASCGWDGIIKLWD